MGNVTIVKPDETVRTKVIAQFEVTSFTTFDKKYTVKVYETGSFWCTCHHFKFQNVPVGSRSCKHTRSVIEFCKRYNNEETK